MDFKRFIEQIINEKAVLELDGLGFYYKPDSNMIGLYRNPENFKRGLDESDPSLFEDDILACMQIFKLPKDEKGRSENCFGVSRVRAKEPDESKLSYGPLIYLLGIQITKNLGLAPFNDPTYVSPEAKNIWRHFYDGDSKDRVDKFRLKKKYHKEEYLNYRYTLKPQYKYDLSESYKITKELVADVDKESEKQKEYLLFETFGKYVGDKMRKMY